MVGEGASQSALYSGTKGETQTQRLLMLYQLGAAQARTVREGFPQRVAPEVLSKYRQQPGDTEGRKDRSGRRVGGKV